MMPRTGGHNPWTKPLPTHPFVGREALLDEIKHHLLNGQHVALYGDVDNQDGLIIGEAGVVVFAVIQFFMRKAR